MNLSWDFAKGMLFMWFLYFIVLGCMCLIALVIDVGLEKAIDILIDKLTSIEDAEVDDDDNYEM